jgi:hypothetical protein
LKTGIYSQSQPQEDSTTINGQGTIPLMGTFGPAFNISFPIDPFNPLAGDFSYGVGFGGGGSVTINHSYKSF